MKKKLLLEEDACAPDAFVSFDQKLKEITGLNFCEFKEKAENKSAGFSVIWHYATYSLESYADCREWHLYEYSFDAIKEDLQKNV